MAELSLEKLEKEKVGPEHKVLELKLTYDNPTILLENYYFWLIDFIKDGLKLKLDKISDTFGASPGSSFLGEMGQRATLLLNQGRQLGALINEIIKAILAIIYEIKWIKSRLKLYDQYKKLFDPKATPEEKRRAHAALLSLKSIWVDRVDSQKGNAAMVMLSKRYGTSTVLDVFFAADKPEDVDKLVKQNIINKRVATIVKSRLSEFWAWLDESEKEIRNRYSLLVSYLKHEVNALFTYFEFARPYLRFARKLLMKDYNSPDVVSIFETAILELTLLATGNPQELEIPIKENNTIKTKKEKYYPVYEIKLYARIYPMGQRVGGSSVYQHIGRVDMNFYAYVLKEEELKELRKSQFERDLLYIEGMTKDTIRVLLDDLIKIFEDFAKETGRDDIKKGLEWLFELKNEKKSNEKNEKKDENTNEKSKESYKEKLKKIPLLDIIFAFEPLIKPVCKGLKELAPKISLSKLELEAKEKKMKKEFEDKMKKLKEDTADLCWKIYETFKKNYGLLAW